MKNRKGEAPHREGKWFHTWKEGKFCEVCGRELSKDVSYRIYLDNDTVHLGKKHATVVHAYLCYNPKCIKEWAEQEAEEVKDSLEVA
jgi:hypothetical protein